MSSVVLEDEGLPDADMRARAVAHHDGEDIAMGARTEALRPMHGEHVGVHLSLEQLHFFDLDDGRRIGPRGRRRRDGGVKAGCRPRRGNRPS
ncbi:hypothetical protein C8D88_11222 [Lentzea atacamensis]|uniref:Uncharacterized protein n=1 Tax=Lentzea atacamensis TaxID=531938 RepID=A0A316HWW1_9PSEU|nr:hypothetical protein [Lentzea atacamensis]PWK82774.1 hypothetical protein C8D88_11222 [Lentzea atacamensis]